MAYGKKGGKRFARKRNGRRKKRTYKKKSNGIARRALGIAKAVQRATRPEVKYVDQVSTVSGTTTDLDHNGYAYDTLGLPIPADWGNLSAATPYVTPLVPSIGTGVGDHGRIGDEITSKWINLRFVVQTPNAYREVNTIYPSIWTNGDPGAGNLTTVSNTITTPSTPQGTLRVMIVQRACGNLLPYYGSDGYVSSYTRPPNPTMSDFYENLDETGSANPYFQNPIGVWFPRPKNEIPQHFKILWQKSYKMGHSNIEDHVFIPYKRRMEYALVSTVPSSYYQPLNDQVFLMMVHDYGLTNKQSPTSTDADHACQVIYQCRFTYNDQ